MAWLLTAVLAACAADPTAEAHAPTCTVTINEVSLEAQYYEDGFDYDYDKLRSAAPTGAEDYTLTFDVSWDASVLTVSEGYFRSVGDVSQVTHTLQRDDSGHFSLQVPAPRSSTACGAYFIPHEAGVFAVKVYFPPA